MRFLRDRKGNKIGIELKGKYGTVQYLGVENTKKIDLKQPDKDIIRQIEALNK